MATEDHPPNPTTAPTHCCRRSSLDGRSRGNRCRGCIKKSSSHCPPASERCHRSASASSGAKQLDVENLDGDHRVSPLAAPVSPIRLGVQGWVSHSRLTVAPPRDHPSVDPINRTEPPCARSLKAYSKNGVLHLRCTCFPLFSTKRGYCSPACLCRETL